jgi:hypothetical protein
MKLTTVRPGLVLCVPHLLEREPRYHYEGCTRCARLKAEGRGKPEPPSATPSGRPRFLTMGELIGYRGGG